MNLAVEIKDDPVIAGFFEASMKELNEFYGIDWVHHVPRITTVPDRRTIDFLRGQKTERWVVGWVDGRTVYVLDRHKMETESSHAYTTESYKALMQHELSHAFYLILSSGKSYPKWFFEGVAVATSGQNALNKKPKELKKFLSFYESEGFGEYAEAGFAVGALEREFGKEKLLQLIKSTKDLRTSADFDRCFEELYKSKPTYEFFNKLFHERYDG